MTNYYYSLTNYPNIYNGTYWGRFDNHNDRLESSIIENRNNFINDFNIKKVISSKIPQYIRKQIENQDNLDLDHREYYKNNDNKYVVIISPYMKNDDYKKINKFILNGYERIYNLYSPDALTFYKELITRSR